MSRSAAPDRWCRADAGQDTRKAGRLSEGLIAWAGRSTRDVVDQPALREAVASVRYSGRLKPRARSAPAFRAEKAGALVRAAKDVGRIGEAAGIRAARDTLKVAENPKELARAAGCGSEGRQTRAILKLLGRGALLLAAGAFNLTMWLFGALLMLFGFLSSIKAATSGPRMVAAAKQGAALQAADSGAGCTSDNQLALAGCPVRAKLAIACRSQSQSPKKATESMIPSFITAMSRLPIRRRRGEPIVLVHALPRARTSLGLYDLSVRTGQGRPPRRRARRSRPWRVHETRRSQQYEIAIMASDLSRADGSLESPRRHHGLFVGSG